jgi:hypothetical protein
MLIHHAPGRPNKPGALRMIAIRFRPNVPEARDRLQPASP